MLGMRSVSCLDEVESLCEGTFLQATVVAILKSNTQVDGGPFDIEGPHFDVKGAI